eukprot:COSAG02_NODE_29118_length_575_cov_20.915966_1_plen_79_part_10
MRVGPIPIRRGRGAGGGPGRVRCTTGMVRRWVTTAALAALAVLLLPPQTQGLKAGQGTQCTTAPAAPGRTLVAVVGDSI